MTVMAYGVEAGGDTLMVPDLLCEKNLKRIGSNWIFESKRSSQLNIFNFSILKTFSFTITYHFSTLQILTTSSW